MAVALGCTLAAAGGALYAGYVGYIDPSAGSLDQSILFLSMVLLGGIQSFVGPFVGAGVVLLLPELLRQLGASSQLAASGRNIAVGIALCILVLARPQGLVGNYRLRS